MERRLNYKTIDRLKLNYVCIYALTRTYVTLPKKVWWWSWSEGTAKFVKELLFGTDNPSIRSPFSQEEPALASHVYQLSVYGTSGIFFETCFDFHPRIFSLASNRSPRKGKAKEENKSYSVCLREQNCPSFSIQPTSSVYPLSEPTRRRLHFRRQVRNSVWPRLTSDSSKNTH